MAWNKPVGASVPTPTLKKKPTAWRGAAAGGIVAVAAAAIVAFFVLFGGDAKPKAKEEKKPTAIKEVKNAEIPRSTKSLTNDTKRMENGVEVIAVKAVTNRTGAVVEKIYLANGKHIERVRPPRSIFSNASDQLIAMTLSVKPGHRLAPLPSLGSMDRDFMQSLLEPIRINDDDPEDVKELKLSVKEARAYIAAEIKNGRTARECLAEYVAYMDEAADRHQMALEEIEKMRKDGTPDEDIATFRDRVNEVFRAKNIPELPDCVRHKEETKEKGKNDE